MPRRSLIVRFSLVAALLIGGVVAARSGQLAGILAGDIGPALTRLDAVVDQAQGGADGASGVAGGSQAGGQNQTTAATSDGPPASSTSSEATGDNPPAVEAVIGGTLGRNGWYTSDVTLDWKIEGGTAAEGSCAPQSITADGTADYSCTATSADGSTRTTKATIARDATAPAGVVVAADRAPDSNGWYNHAFTAAWSGTDATSGIDQCTTTTYSGPDAAAGSLDGTCTDKGGNSSAVVPFAFAYDATAPVVKAVTDRSPDHGEWYNHAVVVSWTSEDAHCDDATTYAGPDAKAATLSGSCTDDAGNKGTASITIAYDDTRPLISITSPAEGSGYVLRQPVAAGYSCTDATAGIDACTGPVADGANLDTATVGSHTFKVTATDQAGNEATSSNMYAVRYAGPGVLCGGERSHEILQPVAADGSSSFNQGRTVPAKFRICDYFGNAVTTAGVVKSFRIVSINGAEADQAPKSTSAHEEYRPSGPQWIFNIDTKPLVAGRYGFRAKLDDGTSIEFAFTLR